MLRIRWYPELEKACLVTGIPDAIRQHQDLCLRQRRHILSVQYDTPEICRLGKHLSRKQNKPSEKQDTTHSGCFYNFAEITEFPGRLQNTCQQNRASISKSLLNEGFLQINA